MERSEQDKELRAAVLRGYQEDLGALENQMAALASRRDLLRGIIAGMDAELTGRPLMTQTVTTGPGTTGAVGPISRALVELRHRRALSLVDAAKKVLWERGELQVQALLDEVSKENLNRMYEDTKGLRNSLVPSLNRLADGGRIFKRRKGGYYDLLDRNEKV